jgi:ribosomal protein S18 acetylase RimI-like enzyme
MIRLIEELSLNAWRALQTVLYDGWLLNFANGYTRRANSVQTLYPSTLDLEEKIDYCEALYTARGLNTVFKLTGAEQSPDLEVALIRRGYVQDSSVSIQTRSLLDVPPSLASTDVEIETNLTKVWLADFCRLRDIEAKHLSTMRAMLSNIVPQAGFFRLLLDNEVAAVGLGVVEHGYVGLYDLTTDVSLRNRGFGTQLILSIFKWGREHGAHTAYLQVAHGNTHALNLYHKLGFREVYRYWYGQKVR